MPVWLQRTFVQPHFTNQPQEMAMKTLYAVALASLIGLTSSVASAEEVAVAQVRDAKPTPATATAGTPAAPVKISQQDKMRLCSKQATGKKGAERKTFMKGCLSKKA
jgi:hypothetical protein